MRNIIIPSIEILPALTAPIRQSSKKLERLKGEITLAVDDVFVHYSQINEEQLLEKIKLLSIKNCQRTPLQLTTVFHEVELLLIFYGEYELARRVCNWHASLFDRIPVDQQHSTYLFHPFLNLLRIDYLQGNDQRAAIHMQTLRDQLNFYQSNNMLAAYQLWQLRANYCYLELIKYFLKVKKYDELKQFFASYTFNHALSIQMKEAFVISLANNAEVDAAYTYLQEFSKTARHAQARHFKLRNCELRIAQAGKNALFSDTQFLYQAMFSIVNEKIENLADLHFILHVAWLLEKAGMPEEAIKIHYILVEAAERLQADYIKARSLISLYELIIESDGKLIIEDLMIELYCATRHGETKNTLQLAMPDLIHVERPSNANQINILIAALSKFKKSV